MEIVVGNFKESNRTHQVGDSFEELVVNNECASALKQRSFEAVLSAYISEFHVEDCDCCHHHGFGSSSQGRVSTDPASNGSQISDRKISNPSEKQPVEEPSPVKNDEIIPSDSGCSTFNFPGDTLTNQCARYVVERSFRSPPRDETPESEANNTPNLCTSLVI